MKLRKKILLISSSAQLGGGPKHIFLLKDLLKNQYDFYLALPKNEFLKKNLDTDKYIQISERKIVISDILNLTLFIKRNSIDIIHAHGKGAGLIGRIIKILVMKPLVYTFHGVHTQCHNDFKKATYILYEYLTGWIDDKKIFVSNSEMKEANKLKIFNGKNFSIINNSTKLMPKKIILNRKTENYNIGIHNCNKNVLSICRLVDQKNIFEIFRIANLLPNYNFIILGDGYLYSKACEFIKFNNINNVYLIGSKNEVFEYLYKADLFLSTSLYEGHPISILEAMSVGIPIVASKVTGNCDTIEHNISGLLYELGNIHQAVNFINLLMKNDEINSTFSSNAYHAHRDKFSINKMKSSYIKFYNSI